MVGQEAQRVYGDGFVKHLERNTRKNTLVAIETALALGRGKPKRFRLGWGHTAIEPFGTAGPGSLAFH